MTQLTATRNGITVSLPIPTELVSCQDELEPSVDLDAGEGWCHSEKFGLSAQLVILSEDEQEDCPGGGEAAEVHDWWMDDGFDDPDPAQIVGTEADYALRSLLEGDESEPTQERHARRFDVRDVTVFVLIEHSYESEPTWRDMARESLGNITVTAEDGTILVDRKTGDSVSNPLDHDESEYEPQ